MFSKTCVVYHNLNNNTYYYKISGSLSTDLEVGYVNVYNHEVVAIIKDIYLNPYIIFEKQYISIRKMVLTPLIAFLQKLNK